MLQKGTKAPYFEGQDENGNLVKLTDFAGKKLVLYFYPKDSTPGCTAEACDLRDNYERFLALGYNVLGVSRDSAASHQRFIAKYSLPFHLIADTVCYGCMLESHKEKNGYPSRFFNEAQVRPVSSGRTIANVRS